MPRKSIPKTLKNKVWDTYIGKKKGVGKCFCCRCDIDSKNFDCGHVISVRDGGPTNLENLRPICAPCNKSMGTENMKLFKDEYFPEGNLVTNLINVNTRVVTNFLLGRLLKR
mgnify:FL=1